MRNGYIDVVKFLFAVMIAEFHLNTGIFPNGRIAVEGFFFISSFLMMCNIERNRYQSDSLGVSTIRFLWNKWKNLFYILLPSALCAYVVSCITNSIDCLTAIERIPLLMFEVIPLRNAGYNGVYVVGISWYLSSMFIALGILYPFCKKFRSSFVLTVCPLIAVLFYGLLSHVYGHIAVGSDDLTGTLINSGVLRALAGSALGCLLYEIKMKLDSKQVTETGRVLFTILEIVGFVYFFYLVRWQPRSKYDYVSVYLLFGLMTIGLCNLSYSSLIFRGRWTKTFGIASTLIVLNHYYWIPFLKKTIGTQFAHDGQAWIYVAIVCTTCLIVYLVSRLLEVLIQKNFCGRIWKIE